MEHRRPNLRLLDNTPSYEWPENAGAMILAALRAAPTNDAERLRAVTHASDLLVMNDEIAAALLAVLRSKDESAVVRARAAIALGPVLEETDMAIFDEGDEELISQETFREIQGTLERLYLDLSQPKEVRRRALEAAIRAPQKWQIEAVREAYRSGDDEWTLTSVFCMEHVEGFNAEVMEALKNPSTAIRVHAARAAGAWEIAAAWPILADIVADEDADKELRLAAIEAVADLVPDEAESVLGDLLDSDDPDIADAAFEAMEMAGAVSGIEDLGRNEDGENEEDEDLEDVEIDDLLEPGGTVEPEQEDAPEGGRRRPLRTGPPRPPRRPPRPGRSGRGPRS